ncbi:hypothetical protein NHH73_25015 [Oxalobacteraceae bacterium OTU3CINTB1]|nr:hypothetical protein NHH73_25015 [Oxalobacteraceae bacterium OTU3CINTB1]
MNREFKHLQQLRPSKRANCTATAFVIPLIIGWYAGYDMLERGMSQAFCLLYSVGLAVLTWTCPIWPKEPRNGQ